MSAFSSLGNRERPPQMIEAGDTILLEDPTVTKIAKKHGRSNAQVKRNMKNLEFTKAIWYLNSDHVRCSAFSIACLPNFYLIISDALLSEVSITVVVISNQLVTCLNEKKSRWHILNTLHNKIQILILQSINQSNNHRSFSPGE